MPKIFDTHLRQLFMLALILLLGILLIATLYPFLPGLLGSITLFILTRKWYTQLTIQRKWNKSFVATLFIVLFILLIAVPLFFSIQLVIPKINTLISNQAEIVKRLEIVSKKAEPYIGKELFTYSSATAFAQKYTAYIPTILNTTSNWLMNFGMMFFFLFYLLYNNQSIESYLNKIIPLNKTDTQQLGKETIIMVRANALGIPLVSMVHGIVAAIGYLIFGVENWALLGLLTGIVAFIPIVGITLVVVPMIIYYYSINQNFTAGALALYSILITGNVDYITRFGLLKKLGNIHPMVTMLGVIVGLKLFGFMGLIFGPLLVSYFIILIKFYTKEFVVAT